jgi:transposase
MVAMSLSFDYYRNKSALGPEAMGTAAKVWHRCRCAKTHGGAPMTQVDDLSRSLITFEQNSTMVVVLEMSQSSWLAAGVVPGIERRPLKKLDPDPTALLRLMEGWRDHAMKVGRMITRIVLAFEAGRDGFWLARWLRARSIEPFVIHSTSVAVSREHRRAKTDRLDTEMLIRVFLGWLRGEPRHCKMVAIPTLEEEDARRPSRERESLIGERTRIINRMKAALIRLGIRGFKPELLKAPQRLEAQYTADGVPIPVPTANQTRAYW